MLNFTEKFANGILGTLSGFDRLIFRGHFKHLSYIEGMRSFLWKNQILLKDFGAFCEKKSGVLVDCGKQMAEAAKRPLIYLPSAGVSKEKMAKEIAASDRIDTGLIALLTAVEPCRTFAIFKNRETKKLELQMRTRKCLFQYFYLMHPSFGFCHVRVQTWFPFEVQVYINGREWLSCMLKRKGIDFIKKENCFTRIDDIARAQKIFHTQLAVDWPSVLSRLTHQVNPGIRLAIGDRHIDTPYWCAHQTEWATDIMFDSKQSLDLMYQKFVVHGFKTLHSPDVMRFLCDKPLHGGFDGQVISDIKRRQEGVRIKHRVGQNSIKAYNKQGSVFRVETTINDPSQFKIFRKKQNATAKEKPEWLPLRKGVADLPRRAEVSQNANNRYLDHLAAVDQEQTVVDIFSKIAKPVKIAGRSTRGINVWSELDAKLLRIIADGKFNLNGFRNKDIRSELFGTSKKSKQEIKKDSSKTSRLIGILRAHGLVKKVPKSHRHLLTNKGKLVVTMLANMRDMDASKIAALVA